MRNELAVRQLFLAVTHGGRGSKDNIAFWDRLSRAELSAGRRYRPARRQSVTNKRDTADRNCLMFR